MMEGGRILGLQPRRAKGEDKRQPQDSTNMRGKDKAFSAISARGHPLETADPEQLHLAYDSRLVLLPHDGSAKVLEAEAKPKPREEPKICTDKRGSMSSL
jgi:hypothetical protein